MVLSINTLKESRSPVNIPPKVKPLTAHDPNQIATNNDGTIDLVKKASAIAMIGGRIETHGLITYFFRSWIFILFFSSVNDALPNASVLTLSNLILLLVTIDGENVFLVKDNIISTPPLSSSILDGITRDSVMKIAETLGHFVMEREITREELYLADELFFTGTAVEITPIKTVDRIQVGN
mgnify:CR=1 FL=1